MDTLLITLSLILLTLVAIRLWVQYGFHRYKGPAIHNFKNNRFHNHNHVKPHPVKDVIKWMRTRKPEKWLSVDIAPMPTPPDRVEGDEVRITFVNHSTFLIQTQGINIITDPVLSNTIGPIPGLGVKRFVAPGITFDQLPKIDMILVSHDHYDHLDLPTVRKFVQRDQARIYTGLGMDTIMKGRHISMVHIQTLDWWQEAQASDHIKIQFVPVQHWSGRWILDQNASLWGGFVIKTPTKQIFFAGDTGYGPHFQEVYQRVGGMDIALLPIGAYEPRWFMANMHMDPEDAVKAHLDLYAKTSIAMHFGTFQLTDEGRERPVEDLQKALKKYKIATKEFEVLPTGSYYQSK